MKVTPKELAQIIKKTSKENRPAVLRSVFRDPQNLGLFGAFFFPDAIQDRVPEFHEDVYRRLANERDEIIAAPRGHAKSTITGLVFLAWAIVNRVEKYIVYVSQSHSKTVQFIEPLRYEFKVNERLKMVYGPLNVGLAEVEDLARDRQDCIDVNEIRIEAVSFDKNMRGFKYRNTRPTIIVLDDIESDDRVHNPLLREKDARKLNRIIIPSLDPKGKIKMIGTILNVESLLQTKIREYDGVIYRAIQEDGTPLWVDRWSKERLESERIRIGGPAFQAEYLNHPVDDESAIIKPEWVRACFDEELSYGDSEPHEYNYLGVDFAFSDRATADKSAFVGLYVQSEGYTIHSLETRKGMSITEQFDYIGLLQQLKNYDDIALEENSIRGMSKDLVHADFPYSLFWMASSDPAAQRRESPDFADKRKQIGKKAMIFRLATQFENRNIRIPYKTSEDKRKSHELLSELTSFALEGGNLIEVGVHPDLPIALGLALELARGSGFVFEMVGGGGLVA